MPLEGDWQRPERARLVALPCTTVAKRDSRTTPGVLRVTAGVGHGAELGCAPGAPRGAPPARPTLAQAGPWTVTDGLDDHAPDGSPGPRGRGARVTPVGPRGRTIAPVERPQRRRRGGRAPARAGLATRRAATHLARHRRSTRPRDLVASADRDARHASRAGARGPAACPRRTRIGAQAVANALSARAGAGDEARHQAVEALRERPSDRAARPRGASRGHRPGSPRGADQRSAPRTS